MKNYFELLNLKEIYNIDAKILDRQYFAMQLQYHPDKAKSKEEKYNNLDISTHLNRAYAILKDPLARAEYLLSLSNINIENDAVTQVFTKEQLNSIWDEMEVIEETDDIIFLEKSHSQKILEQDYDFKLLNEAFHADNLHEVTYIVLKLKYLKTLINNIQEKIKSCK